MKIAFHNRQRRINIESAEVLCDMQALSDALARDLAKSPPRWLKPNQIAEIFAGATLSVALVSSRAIRIVNRDYRNIDKATDVLSFPIDIEAPEHHVIAQEELAGEEEADGWTLGEVIISVDKAMSQADEFGHSLRRELAFLFVHGFLHVLGFDHESKAEEKEMFARQSKILKESGINR